MPVKGKGKDKPKKANSKKNAKIAVPASEGRTSPNLPPEMQPQDVDNPEPESLPPLPDSRQITPESTVLSLDQTLLVSPKSLSLDLCPALKAYVEEDNEEDEDAKSRGDKDELLRSAPTPPPAPAAPPIDTSRIPTIPEENEEENEELKEEQENHRVPGEYKDEEYEAEPEDENAMALVPHQVLEDDDAPQVMEKAIQKAAQTLRATVSSPDLEPPPPPAPIPPPSPSLTDARSAASPPPESHHSRRTGRSSSGDHSSKARRHSHSQPHMPPYHPYMMAPNGAYYNMMSPPHVDPTRHGYPPGYGVVPHEHANMNSHYAGYHNQMQSIAYPSHHNGDHPSPLSDRMIEDGKSRKEASQNHNDPARLLQRIEMALPDLSRLLHSFRDAQGKLAIREAEARQLEAQHEQALMHKDFYIEALQLQMRKTANETAEEAAKLRNTIHELRMDVGNLLEEQKELETNLSSLRQQNKKLLGLKDGLEVEIANLETEMEKRQLAHEKALSAQRQKEKDGLAAQKEKLTGFFEEIRTEDEKVANEKLEALEKALRDEMKSMQSTYKTEKQQVQKEHQEEIQKLKDELNVKASELESKHQDLQTSQTALAASQVELEGVKTELAVRQSEISAKKTELDSTQNELNEARLQHSRELEQFRVAQASELERLTQSHADDMKTIHEKHNSELTSLRDTHEQLANKVKETEQSLQGLTADLQRKNEQGITREAEYEKQLNEKLSHLSRLEQEKEELEKDAMAQLQKLRAEMSELETAKALIDEDRERLRQTLQSLGEATDLRSSKGDTFFIESFKSLSASIINLSKEHFDYLPIDPPKDILEKIPPGMPSFLENTPASRELRSAYIQHFISKTLTYRIFQPFLFTLGRRYDKADTFFQMLSMDIRRKSVRREAFWRQQTLKAAYTTSDAKQSINVVAAVIVDEIVDHVKHFADPKKLDALLNGIRKIVKLAAETWRHARVERELVYAAMPAPDTDATADDMLVQQFAGPAISPTGRRPSSGQILLHLFPYIYREAAHEDFAEDDEKAKPCIYASGTALFVDSPWVVARRQELLSKSKAPTGILPARNLKETVRMAI